MCFFCQNIRCSLLASSHVHVACKLTCYSNLLSTVDILAKSVNVVVLTFGLPCLLDTWMARQEHYGGVLHVSDVGIISSTASANKKSAKRLSEIETRIHATDQEHSSTPSETLYQERFSLQTECDIIMTDRAEDLHRKSRLHDYESGECASKLLSSPA